MPKQKEIIIVIDENNCWNVKNFYLDRDGYPRFKRKGKTLLIYREMARGIFGNKIKGKEILHLCNNRVCINPRHLKLGTHKQNMKHMKECGRARNKYSGKLVK